MEDIKKNELVVDDGFADTAGHNTDRLIRGVIIRCVDGNWTDADGAGIPADTPLIAWAITQAVQRWENKLPVETIIKQPGVPLPDVTALNEKIPEKQWEKGLNGSRPPWAKQHVVYLLDPADGGEFTFISGTTGAAIATERLSDKVKNMRMLRGSQVVPLIELGSKPMQTKFGTKLRPEFVILEWRNLGAPAVPAQAQALIGTKVEEPTLAEDFNDSVPF